MNIGGDGNNLRELKHQLRGETKGDVDTNAVEGDFKVDDPERNIKYRHEGARQAPPAALQPSQQQQSQGTVCWERFLHIRSLKVLLVETDYSTRHVVTALLRNCSYEVTEAANGFQAWKILEDPTNQIDVVLTEVVMPGLNGIGLLHKIMSHKTRNNVPVIMMSSHDSMGIVFKCLSKGAVDFLVKPIRKNELKNLWQHVWRRCHSSSGSGSESGTQTQKSVQSKGVEKSDNDSGSNDEYENGSMGLNVGDGSDTGSGTQSSWTKQAVDIDSPLSATVEDQVPECPDSTCAQVIHSTAELSGNKHAPVIKVKMFGGCKENADDATCNDQEIVVGNVDLKFTHQVEDTTNLVGTKEKHILEKGSGKLKEKTDKVNLDLNSEAPPYTSNCAASMTGSNANTNGPITKNTGTETSLRQSIISDAKAKPLNDVKDAPSHEHDLKRLREGNDVGTAVQEDRNVLRRSDSSAFSRYNASANGNKAAGVNIQSGSPPDSAIDKPKEKSPCDLQSQSNGDHCNQSSNIDMGSTTNRTTPGFATLQNNSTVSSVKHLHSSSVFQPSKGVIFATQLIQSKQADDEAIRNMLVQSSDMFQDSLSQCLAHNCNHRDVQQQQPEPPTDHHAASLEKITAAIPHCAIGSSNGFGGPVEGTAGNYYSANNGSASGSNHGSNEQNGSNGQNGSSTVVNTGGINLESDNGIAGKGGSGSGDGSGSGSGSGNENRLDQNKSSQREAALTKFRQKRKERCFRKKVRYQSRKRLAEQRPRVRGQFVRQTANESSSNGTEGS